MPVGRKERGFALMAVLVTVAAITLATLVVVKVSATARQREREAWLLFVGGEYRQALERWKSAGRGAPGQGPKTLEELLADRRASPTLFHLRRIYPDPLTGRTDWVLLRDASGGITGLHSSSNAAPLKHSGFTKEEKDFASARSYREWVFRPADDGGQASGQNAVGGQKGEPE